MSTTRFIRAWRLMAATVPTRWPVPRPDAGRPSAAAGGYGGFAIGYSCRVDLLCRPAELAAVAQLAMEDDDVLDKYGKFRRGSDGADEPGSIRKTIRALSAVTSMRLTSVQMMSRFVDQSASASRSCTIAANRSNWPITR